jgi:GT2 family glycosyltransferase
MLSRNCGVQMPAKASAIQSSDEVWVILLNFMSADDTIKCWYSLRSLVTPCQIFVVDNCSPDDSATRILQHIPTH